MSRQSLNLLHAGVLPQNDLIKTIAVRANNLVSCLGEHQIANLRASVDSVKRLQGMCVPEADMTVCSSSSCGKKTILMG